jgi:hypothetical protein
MNIDVFIRHIKLTIYYDLLDCLFEMHNQMKPMPVKVIGIIGNLL